MNSQSQFGFSHPWPADFARDLRTAMPLLKWLVKLEREHTVSAEAVPSGSPQNVCCPCCGYPQNSVPDQNEVNRTGNSETMANQADSVYFDFAKKRVLAGGKKQSIGDSQPWRLIELAIRYRSFDIVDTFISFSEWRIIDEKFNPKRRLQVVISKANSLIRHYGLELVKSDIEEDTYTLKGWDNTRHKSNAGEAAIKLKSAFEAMRGRKISRDTALMITLEAFKLDPGSLSTALFIVKCIRKIKNTQVSTDLLRSVNHLFRRRENMYADAIAAIERYDAIQTDGTCEKLSAYKSILDRIRRYRRIIRILPQWAAVCVTEETRIEEIVTNVRAIQQQARGIEHIDKSDHLQSLLNSHDIKNAKSVVISRVKGQCPKRWSGRQLLNEEFDTCFVELILKKVDSAKLQHTGSLASYVKKTIPTMLLDQAFKEVYGLSYSQIKAVGRLRKARDNFRQQFNHDPSEDEVVSKLGISIRRLHDIEEWGRQMKSVSFDQDRDGGSSSDDEYQSY